MLQDCLEVFEAFEKKQKGEAGDEQDIVIDRYVPKDGTYILVNLQNGTVSAPIDIRYDKKTRELEGKTNSLYRHIQFYDYYSSLIDMNKPIDGKKVIHSNNYLSFFVKKDSIVSGKLTKEIIAGYYGVLENPLKKYQGKKRTKELYDAAEEELGEIDTILLSSCRQWVEEHIFCLSDMGIQLERKDYVKIFFILDEESAENTRELYKKEGLRYLYPNIFNSNEYNISFRESIWGMPNNNMGLNSKKVYLEHKTRMETVPYLISKEDVMRQKRLFDYLASLAAVGEVNVYFDSIQEEVFSFRNDETPSRSIRGVYLRLQKEKEVKIREVEYVSRYHTELEQPFKYHNYLERKDTFGKAQYGTAHSVSEMVGVLDEVLFSNWLRKNLFTEAKDLKVTDDGLKQNLLRARKMIFRWQYLGETNGLPQMLDEVSKRAVLGAVRENGIERAARRLNMRLSLKKYFKQNKEGTMEVKDIRELIEGKINGEGSQEFESDEEFFYGVGQMIYYLLTKSKAGNKKMSLANPFLNARTVDVIKDKLNKLFIKYNYEIQLSGSKRERYLLGMICSYVPKGEINQDMMLAGLCSESLIYKKKEEEKKHE